MPEELDGLLEGLSIGEPAGDNSQQNNQQQSNENNQQQQSNNQQQEKIDLIENTQNQQGSESQNQQQQQQNQQQEEPKFSQSEFIKQVFGETAPYKSIDEIKALRFGELPTEHAKIKAQYSELEKDLRALQDRLAVTNSPQYQSALKQAHFAEKTKIDDPVIFRKIERLDPEKIKADPIGALVLKDVCDSPEEIENMAQLKEYYMQKFHLGDYAEEVEDPTTGEMKRVEKEIDKIALRREASQAVKYLTGLKEEINSFKPEVDTTSQKREENLKAWEPFVTTQTDPYLKQIPIPVKEINGIKVEGLAYQLTPEDQTFVKQEMLGLAKQMNAELNKENATAIYGAAMAKLSAIKLDSILSVFGEKMYSNIVMLLKSTYNNFSFPTKGMPRKNPEEVKEKGPEGSVQLDDIQRQAGNY